MLFYSKSHGVEMHNFDKYLKSLNTYVLSANSDGIWKFFPRLGTSVVVPWPASTSTSDPNLVYRTWLEENVGKQGIFWTWRAFFEMRGNSTDPDQGGAVFGFDPKLEVVFLREHHAVMFKLVHG